jgi:hypothetical protein
MKQNDKKNKFLLQVKSQQGIQVDKIKEELKYQLDECMLFRESDRHWIYFAFRDSVTRKFFTGTCLGAKVFEAHGIERLSEVNTTAIPEWLDTCSKRGVEGLNETAVSFMLELTAKEKCFDAAESIHENRVPM